MPGNVGPAQWWEEYMAALSPILGARSRVAVTPQDNVDLARGPCRAIYSATAGNIALVLADDTSGDSEVYAFAAGEIKSLMARQIMNTGTTCTGIKALY